MKVLLVATNRERSPYPVAPLGALSPRAQPGRAAMKWISWIWAWRGRPNRSFERNWMPEVFRLLVGIRNLDNCWGFMPRSYFDEVRSLAETVRRSFKGPLILGGSGFSVSPNGWMRRLEADCGVVGEGERAFTEVLTRLEAGRSLEGIDGVITSPKGEGVAGVLPPRPIERLGELPPPAHDLCSYAPYLRRGGFVGVQTKRGCPLGCTYCVYPKLEGRRYRLRPPEDVVREIETVAAGSKLRHFFFVDSVFNDPRAHALAVCAELARRKLPVRWSASCKPLGFDAEVARAMAQGGCSGVEFGLDVATPRMLAALGKPFGQEEIRISLQAARDAGLPFAIYLLFGGPGETWADVKDTQAFLDECAPANAVFATYGIRVYEGTSLAETAVHEGVMAPDADLFVPVYYLSPELAQGTEEKLDCIARRRAEWSSPVDWRGPVARWGQKVTVWLNVRPQWKYMRGYGGYIRRRSV